MERLTREQIKDFKVLTDFVRLFCACKHDGQAPSPLTPELSPFFPKGVSLCAGCRGLLAYALDKRRNCPLEPKPSCKDCRIHCYSMDYRSRIREIMAFSGRKMIMRGRIDYLWHIFPKWKRNN